MATLHEKIPCSKGYFRLRKKFKDREESKRDHLSSRGSSPIRVIASPKMMSGLIG
jgi:hypothetical protein